MNAKGSDRRAYVYHCSAKGDCELPATAPSEELDPLLEEFIFAHCRPRRSTKTSKTQRCEAAVAQAQGDLASYRDNVPLQRTLGLESFEAGLAKRAHVVERRLLELARHKRATELPTIDVESLRRDWADLSWDQRRKAVGKLIDFVVVERGHSPIIERAWVFRAGRGPVISGPRRRIIFKQPSTGRSRLAQHRPWTEPRIERELKSFFLERKPRWPGYREFSSAGQSRLYAQVMAWGGPYFWGNRLGISVPGWTVSWTRPNLYGALRAFLDGKTAWPSRPDFQAMGMNALYEAIKMHGGFAYWAEEFGLAYNPRNGSAGRIWSSEKVEHDLRIFLGDRPYIPARSVFFKADESRLYAAMTRYGGINYWGDRLGLPTARDVLQWRTENGGELPTGPGSRS